MSIISAKVDKITVTESLTHKKLKVNIVDININYKVSIDSLVNSGRTVSVNLKNCVTDVPLYDSFNSQTMLDINCKIVNVGYLSIKRCMILRYKTSLEDSNFIEEIEMMAQDMVVSSTKTIMPPIQTFVFR